MRNPIPSPPPAPPLPLTRIHRLLRPLRSSLLTLTRSLTEASAPVAASTNVANGQGKRRSNLAKAQEEQDAEYTGSSPFGGGGANKRRRKLLQKSGATYGSKKATAGATIATVKARTGKSPPLVPTDARTKLNGALLNPDTVNKALKLIAAYQNVLEACYAPSSSSPSRRQVPTLVETMSRELGWTIEESMRELVEAQVEQGEREGGLLDDGEDHTSLADEWYEAAPEYCSRWILAQHATCIVVGRLGEEAFVVLECLLDICVATDAPYEAARFYDPLNTLGLASPPINKSNSTHTLACRARQLSNPAAYFSSLLSTLLLSSFSDRFFYSDFISLAHVTLVRDQDNELVSRLMSTVCEVGREMLMSIEQAGRSEEMVGGQKMSAEAVSRIAKEVRLAASFLTGADEGARGLQDDTQGTTAIETTARAVYELLDLFPEATSTELSASCIILAFTLLLRHQSAETCSHLDLLVGLNSMELPSSDQLHSFVQTRSSDLILSLSALLVPASLHRLDALLLQAAVDRYDLLVDVRSNSITCHDRLTLESRLEDAEGKCVAAGEGTAWRYEAMTGGFVAVTPAKSRNSSKGKGRLHELALTSEADWEGSPLAVATLSRSPWSGRKKASQTMTPLRARGLRERKENLRYATDEEAGGEELEATPQPRRAIKPSSSSNITGNTSFTTFDLDHNECRPPLAGDPVDVLDLSMDASDDETSSNDQILLLESGSYSGSSSTTSTSRLELEILSHAPSAFPTSELDDLDLLGAPTRRSIAIPRARSGHKRSRSNAGEAASGGKRKAKVSQKTGEKNRRKSVRFEGTESEESEDELAMR